MSEDTLTTVIERAISKGWDMFGWKNNDLYDNHSFIENSLFVHYQFRGRKYQNMYSLSDIIFNHDFAKAYWGEEEQEMGVNFCLPKYLVELNMLVIKESDKDRLAYVYESWE